ncbi:MAG: cobalamin-dependent protein [Verrucomicrobia bacterium]|nr:cobalamin-dependent protein [Verrucomicrobiota bacterium]
MAVRLNAIAKLPNVGLAYFMTAAERARFDFDLIDIDAHRYSEEQVEALVRQAKCDVVAMGTLVSVYGRAKQLFKMVRRFHPHVKIDVGNTLATSILRILLSKTDADICVLGEGDETFVDLVQALDEGRSLHTVQGIAFTENSELVQTPQRSLIANIDDIPYPNYDLMNPANSSVNVENYLMFFVENEEDLVAKFEMFNPAHIGYYSTKLRSNEGDGFHYTFCGVK